MTLTVALIGRDGIVAATDSRGTFGDPREITAQNDTMLKLHRVTEHVVVMLAGTAELGTQLMVDIRSRVQDEGAEGVTRVMEITRETTRQRYGEWFPNWAVQGVPGHPLPERPGLQMIVTGYDRDAAGAFIEPKIFQLISQFDFAPMLSNHGFGLQGVPQYALYLLNRLYVPDSSMDELKALAAYVITETASQDGKVGGPVQMAGVERNRDCVILTAQQVEDVVSANAERSARLKSSFFAGEQARTDED